MLKTEIHINEREIARKGIAGGKTLLWEDVISIERGHIYTISLDKPRDITITAANNNRIYVYGFLEDIEGVEHDIREYSKKEFVQKN
ncbi:MAG: hypothetical protein HZB62_12000 [Nitrospirae bacterium]|nr:hypothetical protein [Nitrospirota bacterium]